MPEPRVHCGECLWWERCDGHGHCRAKAPVGVPVESIASSPSGASHCCDVWGAWPLTDSFDWCGEGKKAV
jgi:hypothetical protein